MNYFVIVCAALYGLAAIGAWQMKLATSGRSSWVSAAYGLLWPLSVVTLVVTLISYGVVAALGRRVPSADEIIDEGRRR